jgi:hypothetical protein
MKKNIIVILFCMFSLPFMAMEQDSSVVFKAGFLNNELQCYEVTRVEYTLQKGDTTALQSLRFKVHVNVTDSTDSYYILSWRFSDYSIDTNDLDLKEMIALARPAKISYRISKPGVLIEFLDWEEVNSCLNDALPKVLEPFLTKRHTDSVSKAEVSRIYELRETMSTLMLQAVRQFHQAYGLGYKLGEVIEDPTEVNSRFSSKPIKGVIRKKLARIDTENHFAELTTATFLNKNELKQALSDYLHTDTIPSSSLDQENIGGLVMDLSTGWLIWSFDQREGKAGNSIYGDMIEIQHISETI